jgi:hypothetical protein
MKEHGMPRINKPTPKLSEAPRPPLSRPGAAPDSDRASSGGINGSAAFATTYRFETLKCSILNRHAFYLLITINKIIVHLKTPPPAEIRQHTLPPSIY